jgi:hypothetical protein
MPNSAAAPSAATATAARTQRSGLRPAEGVAADGVSAAGTGADPVSGADFGTDFGDEVFLRDIVRCG